MTTVADRYKKLSICLFTVLVLLVIAVAILAGLLASSHVANQAKDENVSLPPRLVIGQVSLDVSTGAIQVSSKGGILTGKVADWARYTANLRECTEKDELCLVSNGDYKIIVKTLPVEIAGCYRFSFSDPDTDNSLSTCFDYGNGNWYGAAEVHAQSWPINKWSINLQEFVVRDPYFPGVFGSVQERYWLTSAGFAIHVPSNVPLFVSMNATGDKQLCLTARYKDSVYRNINNSSLNLTYDVCMADDMTVLHKYMSSTYWKIPVGRPNVQTMLKPIWSTWVTYKKDINETSLQDYADKILSYNLSISQLEIDDDWTPYYGDWVFNVTKFPAAKKVIEALKSKIPAVTVWVHPFINTDAKAFIETADKGLLMNNINKAYGYPVPGLVRWWNPGYAGLLDFSNNLTQAWFLDKLKYIQDNYSIDSFKFDAGEIKWMPYEANLFKSYQDPSEYVAYYVDTAWRADMSGLRQEVRVGWKTQHVPILVRMLDRDSVWTIDNGIKTLIPAALTFGLIGYPFVLPDMIGGNAYNGTSVDSEIFIRWLQVNVFLPAIQFSIPPWSFNDAKIINHTKEMLELRESYAPLFDRLSNESVTYGWPMVRPLWWADGKNIDCQSVDDQFLLGNDLLVAPVVEKGAESRDIYLPSGKWKDRLTGDIIDGGIWLRDYSASLYQLPFFERQASSAND